MVAIVAPWLPGLREGDSAAPGALSTSTRPRQPVCTLDDLLLGLSTEQRATVKAFLEAQEFDGLEDLAAVTPNDLNEVFKATPAELTLQDRSAVRRICSSARRKQEEAVLGLGAAEQRPPWARCWLFGCKFAALVILGFANSIFSTWSDLDNFDHLQCNKPRADGAGIKVIVTGLQGMGSQSVLRALEALGLPASYSSEDFSFSVWSGLSSAFWSRPENGGRRPHFPVPPLRDFPPLLPSELWSRRPLAHQWSTQDVTVLNGTRPRELSSAILRCGIDAVALDGMERLFFPMFQLNPNVKVISLRRSSHWDYAGSVESVRSGFQPIELLHALLSSSQYVLPTSLLFKILDAFGGFVGEDAFYSGIRHSKITNPHIRLLTEAEYTHRTRRHFYAGLGFPQPSDKATYNWFYDAVRRAVPQQRLLEFDVQRSTWQDLCGFLGVERCPGTGHLPRPKDQMEVFCDVRLVWYLFFWYVNWQILSLVPRLLRGLLKLSEVCFCWAVQKLRFFADPWVLARLYLMLMAASYTRTYDLWTTLGDIREPCAGPVLPGNRSGIKVLVAGFAKTGTRTMSRTLWQLGLEGSYHSEEFSMYVWSRLADDYWARPENGGRSPTPYYSKLADLQKEYWPSDKEVLQNLSPQELANAVSRCRVEAVAFDCIEELFWPLYNVSPGVKVISLSWRTYKEYSDSALAFHRDFNFMVTSLSYIFYSVHLLPWTVFFKYLDRLVGGPVATALAEGRPLFNQEFTPFYGMFHSMQTSRRIIRHWYSGLMIAPHSQEKYDGFYQEVRSRVPRERLLEWDMRRHTWEDLCRFLEVESCPRTGRLERAASLFNLMRDFPICHSVAVPIFLTLHFINWYTVTLLVWVLGFLIRGLAVLMSLLCCARLQAKAS